jgi:hypothetical protein
LRWTVLFTIWKGSFPCPTHYFIIIIHWKSSSLLSFALMSQLFEELLIWILSNSLLFIPFCTNILYQLHPEIIYIITVIPCMKYLVMFYKID